MDVQEQLKLQAYLDGELTEAEARAVANRLAQDQEAMALLAELRHTRQAMVGFETGITLPESREFYWSRIQREIARLDAPARETASPVSLLARLRRILVPAAGVAFLVAVGLVASNGLVGESHHPGIETSLGDSAAFSYHDDSAGATLVWLSYPAENEPSEDDPNNLFTD